MMIQGDILRTVLDWQAPEEEFKKQVNQMISDGRKFLKVITLPVTPQSDPIPQLAMLLSMVNCEGCQIECCKQSPTLKYQSVHLTRADCERLNRLELGNHIIGDGINSHLPLPCPFLKKHRCTIYNDRPLTCIMYPFQPGGKVRETPALAVSPTCPEARRIAKRIFNMTYLLKNRKG